MGPVPSSLARLPVTPRSVERRVCLAFLLRAWTTKTISWRAPSLLRPPSGAKRNQPGTGILTCFPSPTGFPLGLGTDSPRVDERSPGILRLSAKTVLASFNATYAGIVTSVRSRCPFGHPSLQAERSSTTTFWSSAASVSCLSPVTFSAQTPLTSELLRTLSRMAASKPTSCRCEHERLKNCHQAQPRIVVPAPPAQGVPLA